MQVPSPVHNRFYAPYTQRTTVCCQWIRHSGMPPHCDSAGNQFTHSYAPAPERLCTHIWIHLPSHSLPHKQGRYPSGYYTPNEQQSARIATKRQTREIMQSHTTTKRLLYSQMSGVLAWRQRGERGKMRDHMICIQAHSTQENTQLRTYVRCESALGRGWLVWRDNCRIGA